MIFILILVFHLCITFYFFPATKIAEIETEKADVFAEMRAVLDFVQILALLLEAGQSIPCAFIALETELKEKSCKQAVQSVLRLKTQGLPFGMALEKVSHGLGSQMLSEFFMELAHAVKMGSAMIPVLNRRNHVLNENINTALEERVAKAPIKMLFPVVLFILPIIFLLLAGGLIKEIGSVLSN